MQSLARNCNMDNSHCPRRDLVIATLAATELSKNRAGRRTAVPDTVQLDTAQITKDSPPTPDRESPHTYRVRRLSPSKLGTESDFLVATPFALMSYECNCSEGWRGRQPLFHVFLDFSTRLFPALVWR